MQGGLELRGQHRASAQQRLGFAASMTMTVAQAFPSGFQVILCLICSEVTQGHRQEVGPRRHQQAQHPLGGSLFLMRLEQTFILEGSSDEGL